MALLASLLGQDTARTTLLRALQSNRVHHAYLFDGPPGVGKGVAALGLAQALVCEQRNVDGHACGTCSACERALPEGESGLPRHPDIVVLERGLYEPAQIGRRTPETRDLSIDQVRTLVLARAAFPPHEGRAKVFIVRRAEELSVGAANALLKTLEEPQDRTHFVLLTSQKGALLPTIRSRALALRFGPLPPSALEQLLIAQGAPEDLARRASGEASGSFDAAKQLLDGAEHQNEFVNQVLAARKAPSADLAYALAEQAKGDGSLSAKLEGLALAFAREANEAARAGLKYDGSPERHDLVLHALRKLRGNAAAQLTMESLMLALRDTRD